MLFKTKQRRKSTRIYWVAPNKYLQITREYSMKFGRNLYYVVDCDRPQHTLFKGMFAEAKQFVRDYGSTTQLAEWVDRQPSKHQ